MNNIEDFVLKQKQTGAKAGVFFSFEYTEKVRCGNIECNGFFDPNYLVKEKQTAYLSVAIKKDLSTWLPIFIHETSHMDQWLEKSDLWLKFNEFEILDKWLDGEDFPISDIIQFVEKVILLEADCERRTIEKIKQYNLPIDIGVYAQSANAYLYFYQWVIKNRRWYDTAPYEIAEILYYMPKEMQTDQSYLQPLSKLREKMFDLCKTEKLILV